MPNVAIEGPPLCKTVSATSGTSDYELSISNNTGPYRTPKQAVTDGDLTNGSNVTYMAWDTTVTGDASFELGVGIYNDTANTIARNTEDVLAGSSGPNNLVSWGESGQRDIYIIGMIIGPIHVRLSGTTLAAFDLASTVAAFQNNNLTSSQASVVVVAGNAAAASLYFGDADDPTIGGMIYSNSVNWLTFRVNNSSAFGVDSSLNMHVGNITPNERLTIDGALSITDGMTAPSATAGYAKIYVDTADGDLKVVFGDGTVKTISVDT